MARRQDGLDLAFAGFLTMLHEARSAVELAVAARTGATPATEARRGVATLEQRADAAEMQLRRQLLVHATVHGAGDLPACLTYMSIAKDAERISDLALALCGVAELVSPPPEPVLTDLAQLGATVTAVLADTPVVVEHEDADAARELIKRARGAQQACSARLDDIVRDESDGASVPAGGLGDLDAGVGWDDARASQPVALALTYRHLGRIAANTLNVVSSVVVPLDRLDYPATME